MTLLCKGCQLNKDDSFFPLRKDRSNGTRRPYCTDCNRDIAKARYNNHKRNSYFKLKASRAKSRAQYLKVPFDLDADYLESIWTDTCPVLGVVLHKYHKQGDEDSAELDRNIPSLGYVRGNVTFLSRRANRSKQDLSLDEMRAMVKWMEGLLCK